MTDERSRILLAHILAEVPVLEEALLGIVGLLQLHAEVQVHEHDGLELLLGEVVLPVPAAPDELVENIESSVLLPHRQQLCNIRKKKKLVKTIIQCTVQQPFDHLKIKTN